MRTFLLKLLYLAGIWYLRERLELLKAARDGRLDEYELAFLESGNIGIVTRLGVIVSPSGKSFAELTIWNLVLVLFTSDIDKSTPDYWGRLKPTSEWRIYLWLALCKKLEPGIVILHTHSRNAETFSCLRVAIPGNVIYTTFGASWNIGGIPCSAFFDLPSTPDLARNTAKTIGNGYATFIASHGQLVLGKNASETVTRAMRVDRAAHQYMELLKLAAAGHPWVPMDLDQLLALPGLYGNYGQPKKK